ncbi:MAG: hypothetical protein K9K37_10040 [Desulfocapsa sp.]|nr:hypothetical protein [Desulfocapsa sp.]
MCLESTVGAIGVVMGIVVLISAIKHSVFMDNWSWSFLVMAVMAMSYLTKDFVLAWNPFRILRDKDHMNIDGVVFIPLKGGLKRVPFFRVKTLHLVRCYNLGILLSG